MIMRDKKCRNFLNLSYCNIIDSDETSRQQNDSQAAAGKRDTASESKA